MRLRSLQSWTWVTALALLGMLMHAGLTARHAVNMGLHAGGGVDVAIVICHGDGTLPTVTQLPMPDDPAGKLHGTCPVCVGAVAGAAMLPAVAFSLFKTRIDASHDEPQRSRFEPSRGELPPPGCGPPRLRA